MQNRARWIGQRQAGHAISPLTSRLIVWLTARMPIRMLAQLMAHVMGSVIAWAMARVRGSWCGRVVAQWCQAARDEWDALCPLVRDALAPVLARCAPLVRALEHLKQLGRRLLPTDPLPPLDGRAARRGLLVTGLLALGFALFFSAYLFATHDAYQTHAEDMGIMTQALWNASHGGALHQTICDPIGDTNCLGDVSRLAIHFEPILFLLAPLYALVPSPKTLQLVQVLVVAAGAFPAYWLASRRLRSAVAGVIFAALYLMYPPLDAALTFDFHAVTLAAPLLLFALYFLLTRQSLAFVIAAALAIGTKEEVALTVAMLGLYAALVQGRRRFGGGVALFAACWIVMEVLVMHAVSPLGHSPMTSRYAAFGSSPQAILLSVVTQPLVVVKYVLDPGRIEYLGALLGPLGFVGLASPLTLLLAAPAIGLNMLSDNPIMYSGLAQYSAEIVPVMLLAAIDGTGKLAPLGDRLAARFARWLRRSPNEGQAPTTTAKRLLGGLRVWAWRIEESPTLLSLAAAAVAGLAAALRLAVVGWWAAVVSWARRRDGLASARIRHAHALAWAHESLQKRILGRALPAVPWRRALVPVSVAQLVLLAILLVPVAAELGVQQRASYLPIGRNFAWPASSAHIKLADSLVARIPPTASVAAQSDLAPHLSNRRHVYLFPDQAFAADYDLLDVTGNIFPYGDPRPYVAEVRAVLGSGLYQVVAAEDGYLLLQRATAAELVGRGPQAAMTAPGTPVDPAHLPPSFYSFTQAAPAAISHRVHGVSFRDGGASIQLVGYDLSPSRTIYLNYPILTVTTYWRVTGHLDEAVAPELQVTFPSAYAATYTSFPATDWLPMTAWPGGATMVVRSEPLALTRGETGMVQIGVRLQTADGPLNARAFRFLAPAMLHAQTVPWTDARGPGPNVAIAESGTLVAFAQERIKP